MKSSPVIESLQNRQIKELAALGTKKGRRKTGRFIAEGVRLAAEALKSESVTVHRLVILADLAEEPALKNLIAGCDGKNIPVLPVTREIMNKISQVETSQGVLAEVSRPAAHSIDDADFNGITILAHGIQDPRNMGLLIRTAEAAGVSAFFAPPGSTDPFHPTAVQTSMGAVFHHNIISDADSAAAIDAARRNGAVVVGATPRGGTPIERWQIPSKFMLALGNEAAGLDDGIGKKLDESITLPMWGHTESLNVAVSAGIILYLAKINKGNK